MHPKFDWTGVQIHDIQIMEVHVNVTETRALTIQQSVTDPTKDVLVLLRGLLRMINDNYNTVFCLD